MTRRPTLALLLLLSACGDEETVHYPLTDLDGDGWVKGVDCDDGDATVGAGRDWYQDADGDGYGDPDAVRIACEAPEGRVAEAGDCDDADAAVHPGATDAAGDGVDQDCDGVDGGAGGGDTGGGDTGGGDTGGGDTGGGDTGA